MTFIENIKANTEKNTEIENTEILVGPHSVPDKKGPGR